VDTFHDLDKGIPTDVQFTEAEFGLGELSGVDFTLDDLVDKGG